MKSDYDKIAAAILTVGRLATSKQGGQSHNWVEAYYNLLNEIQKREDAREATEAHRLADRGADLSAEPAQHLT